MTTTALPTNSTEPEPEPSLSFLAAAVADLRNAVSELHTLVGVLARDHADTASRVEEHAQRLAVRSLLASLPETAAVVGLAALAVSHAVSGEMALTAILGVLGFRLAPGRNAGASFLSPPPPPSPPKDPQP